MRNNIKDKDYRGFVRSTSNIATKTDRYQVSLPPHIWRKMDWKLNENIRIVIDKENKCLKLTKEKK